MKREEILNMNDRELDRNIHQFMIGKDLSAIRVTRHPKKVSVKAEN